MLQKEGVRTSAPPHPHYNLHPHRTQLCPRAHCACCTYMDYRDLMASLTSAGAGAGAGTDAEMWTSLAQQCEGTLLCTTKTQHTIYTPPCIHVD